MHSTAMALSNSTGANWRATTGELYDILGRIKPGETGDFYRNTISVFNEVRHDFSKLAEATDKRGILFWAVRLADGTLSSYAAGQGPTTWAVPAGFPNQIPVPPGGAKGMLAPVPPSQMNASRLVYMEQIMAGLIKSTLGNDNSGLLDDALSSLKPRSELLADKTLFPDAGPSTPQQHIVSFWKELVYPKGCVINMDHSSIDLASALQVVQSVGANTRLEEALPDKSKGKAPVTTTPSFKPGDILSNLIKSKEFVAGSQCALVATMDCVPKCLHDAWSAQKNPDLILILLEAVTAKTDPGTGHLVRATKLRKGQFIARECGPPSARAGAAAAGPFSADGVARPDPSMSLSGSRVYRMYSRPYNVKTLALINFSEDPMGSITRHDVRVRNFCFPPGDPAPASLNTNQGDLATPVGASHCLDVIPDGTSSKATPFSRANIMFDEAYTFRDRPNALPDFQTWNPGSEKDLLGFFKIFPIFIIF